MHVEQLKREKLEEECRQIMRQKKSKKEKEDQLSRLRLTNMPKKEHKIESANQLNLRQQHVLMKSVINFK